MDRPVDGEEVENNSLDRNQQVVSDDCGEEESTVRDEEKDEEEEQPPRPPPPPAASATETDSGEACISSTRSDSRSAQNTAAGSELPREDGADDAIGEVAYSFPPLQEEEYQYDAPHGCDPFYAPPPYPHHPPHPFVPNAYQPPPASFFSPPPHFLASQQTPLPPLPQPLLPPHPPSGLLTMPMEAATPPLSHPHHHNHHHPAWATMAHQYYESRMRDHAVAYATAAAGAAWAAAQIAASAAEFVAANSNSAAGAAMGTLQVKNVPVRPTMSASSVYGEIAHPTLSHTSQKGAGGGGEDPTSPVTAGVAVRASTYAPSREPPFAPPPRKSKRREHCPSDGDSSSTTAIPRRVVVSSDPRSTGGNRNNKSNKKVARRGWSSSSYRGGSRDSSSYRLQELRSDGDSCSSSGGGSSFFRSLSVSSPAPLPLGATCDDEEGRGGKAGRPTVRHRQQHHLGSSHNRPPDRHTRLAPSDDGASSSSYSRRAVGASSSSSIGKQHKKPRSGGNGGNSDSGGRWLVGKSGVSALYEWCSKRQKVPELLLEQVQDEYECRVLLDGIVVGSGRGRAKSSAKQEAARRAVLALIPGVIFDASAGIVIDVVSVRTAAAAAPPVTESRGGNDLAVAASAVASSLDDLAPHLAKRLAIGHDEEDSLDRSYGVDLVVGTVPTSVPAAAAAATARQKSTPRSNHKRSLQVYPGTSTTSEEEDENAYYYASRGASVCTSLLHAIVQIDARIREPPEFSYEVTPLPSSAAPAPCHQTSQLGDHRNEEDPRDRNFAEKLDSVARATARIAFPAVTATRGVFACTATLRLYDEPLRGNRSQRKDGNEDYEDEEAKAPSFHLLKATSTGSTKKESRQMASARLLALLFPDCKTMVEVKAAAEAAREAYAASRGALKHGSHHHQQRTPCVGRRQQRPFRASSRPVSSIVRFATSGGTNDPPLPSNLRAELEKVLDSRIGTSDNDESLSDADALDASIVARQASRQRQLDCKIELALQTLNDQDEEGRILPPELTDDDVGRTILRRAVPDDFGRIKKLLLDRTESPPPNLGRRWKPLVKSVPFVASQLWSNTCIILLLCRAIGAYEDPPLGCAILTLGFSMEAGSLLCVTQLASEPHLPRERFVECLQAFARAMKCTLRLVVESPPGEVVLSHRDLRTIVSERLHPETMSRDEARLGATRDATNPPTLDGAIKRISSPLQSVLEESEVSEASSVEKRPTKRPNKPSKRSRFA